MAAATARRVKTARAAGTHRRSMAKQASSAALTLVPPKPVWSVKLKTVSLLTMLFSLLCLGAFLAGRPPVSAARLNPGNAGAQSQLTHKATKAAARIHANKRSKATTATVRYGADYGKIIRGDS
jgi:hypothetical protein